jgi:RNA polymerase sigma-70 factor (ECF subfamily)
MLAQQMVLLAATGAGDGTHAKGEGPTGVSLDDAAIARLVDEAREGDAWAFGRLFDHYHLGIHRYIASRIHRPADAEDLTQLVFVKALEALPRYQDRGIPFAGWLFRLARNAVIDFVRTRRDHLGLDVLLDSPRPGPGPDELFVVRQDMDAVGAALATLTDDQRDAIALRFFAGLSAREAAQAMGKQEGTVRGLQFRAIAALRRELGIDGEAGPATDVLTNGLAKGLVGERRH